MDNRTYKYSRASLQNLRVIEKMFPDLPNEDWILESQSKYYPIIRINGSPGFLSLSKQRFVFEPAKTSLMMNKGLEIQLVEIKKVKKTRSLLFLPNAIKIICNDGKSFLFITWDRNKFYELYSKWVVNQESET